MRYILSLHLWHGLTGMLIDAIVATTIYYEIHLEFNPFETEIIPTAVGAAVLVSNRLHSLKRWIAPMKWDDWGMCLQGMMSSQALICAILAA